MTRVNSYDLCRLANAVFDKWPRVYGHGVTCCEHCRGYQTTGCDQLKHPFPHGETCIVRVAMAIREEFDREFPLPAVTRKRKKPHAR